MLEPDNPERFVLFPIPPEQKPIWDMYKKAVASFWTMEEVDLWKIPSSKRCPITNSIL